jgi:hypothetical protein
VILLEILHLFIPLFLGTGCGEGDKKRSIQRPVFSVEAKEEKAN